MKAALRAWIEGLEPRERYFVLGGAIVLAVTLMVSLVLMPLDAALSRALAGNQRRRGDLEWMRVNAAEIRAGAATVRAPSAEPPLVLVDRTARDAGLGEALRGTQPAGDGGLQVQLQGAAFDAMIAWIGQLDARYGLAVRTITVDRDARTGTVDANLTFAPPAH
ncbi:MAG: type II secretion system protein M [Gammaproteobacteria bacterium]|nr:type II secretion system protein M [Gammaproteobacteria bacterium]